jgi:hypothetical protein
MLSASLLPQRSHKKFHGTVNAAADERCDKATVRTVLDCMKRFNFDDVNERKSITETANESEKQDTTVHQGSMMCY